MNTRTFMGRFQNSFALAGWLALAWRTLRQRCRLPPGPSLLAASGRVATARAAPPLLGGLRPVIAFGADRRSAEVRRRFEAVSAVVNEHLPESASAIEVWVMEGGLPTRLG